MASQPGMGEQNLWSVYLATDDVRKTLEAATASGGVVHVDAMDVADLGTMAFVTDAGGGFVGLWQPRTHQGFGVLGEAGAPSWFELAAGDYDASVVFYRDVFRWDTTVLADTEAMRYTTLGSGDGALAGILDASGLLPDGIPPHWSVYFGVEDADAALADVARLGGSTLEPPADTPYGRLAAAADPLGARFKLVAPNAAMPAPGR
jgi:predicted enzyme related to lactoylglutathione lyase